jgi:uncharacterized RDD family membrane protein YckC
VTSDQRLGIVTPEAVELDLPPAGIATRLLAKVIDLACQGVLLWLGLMAIFLTFGSGPFGGEGGTAVRVAGILWTFFVFLGAPILSEALWVGRTPGKAILGLRAVTLDGGPIQPRHSTVRGVFQLVDVYIPTGLVPAMLSPRSQRFGDLAAGTFVLNERTGTTRSQPIAFFPPVGWESYVGVLDIGRVGEQQYRLVRSFLLRVTELDAGARLHLAGRLAGQLRPLVSPAPPPELTPELFLHCVVSAYQYRNGGFPTPSEMVGPAGLVQPTPR